MHAEIETIARTYGEPSPASQGTATLAGLMRETRRDLALLLLVVTGGDLPEFQLPEGALAEAEAAGLVSSNAYPFYPSLQAPAGQQWYQLTYEFVALAAGLVVGEENETKEMARDGRHEQQGQQGQEGGTHGAD